jgi:hypothetical protein
MKQLEKKGFIAADPGIPRGYRILSQGSQAPVTPSQRPGGCPLLACDSVDGRTDPLVLKIVLDPATRRDLLSGALLTVRHLSPSETGSTDCGGAAVLGQVTAIAQPMGNHRP